MKVIIEVDSVNAQFVYVKNNDDGYFTLEIGDVEIHLPRWALEDLSGRILSTLESLDKTESV